MTTADAEATVAPPERLRTHDVTLAGPRVVLRPMTEIDWDVLLAWNNDPEVLYYSESDHARSCCLGEVQRIYRSISRHAFCFIIEHAGRAIGECWLQEMNMPRVLERYPGKDLRRIDIAIGERSLWGRGLGTEALRLLVDFGFERERCHAIFGCGVADYNPRSRRMFEKLGFVTDAEISLPAGAKAAVEYDLVLTRERYERSGREKAVAARRAT